jgi:starvation-inducible DNA-binding protein
VHEMIDPQVDTVRLHADSIAERIAAMGGEPQGTPGAIVRGRTWDDYGLLRAKVPEHLAALNEVYNGVVQGHRAAFEQLEELDAVSHDMLVQQTQDLEQFQWFIRAHLEDKGGHLTTASS